ncbi:hypothetical protein B0J13DRAFT_247006 [Dactylonectria estremocensis]|uniref:Uncharacterized protein n=1 Tax=Dactylonectria estremocensis TaxID=1079267 RepID=A0A9P9JC38_9HYPO|nr:hypothetical protein B0J13DRAFT_247006 [Dactylonectria estremocensis]
MGRDRDKPLLDESSATQNKLRQILSCSALLILDSCPLLPFSNPKLIRLALSRIMSRLEHMHPCSPHTSLIGRPHVAINSGCDAVGNCLPTVCQLFANRSKCDTLVTQYRGIKRAFILSTLHSLQIELFFPHPHHPPSSRSHHTAPQPTTPGTPSNNSEFKNESSKQHRHRPHLALYHICHSRLVLQKVGWSLCAGTFGSSTEGPRAAPGRSVEFLSYR